MSLKKSLFFSGLTLALVFLLAACGAKPIPTETPATTEPTETEATASPADANLVIPFESIWAASAHADLDAPAFTHWNEDDPAVVPADCAKCHTGTGLEEFTLTQTNQDVPVPGGVIVCTTCHNDAVDALTSVTFPSGKVAVNLGAEARCISCHQGRESKASVDAFLETTVGAEADPDVVSEDLTFVNVHYFSAGASMYASMVSGGYEYENRVYDGKFTHIEGVGTCLDCHDSHSLEVKIFKCAECHENSSTVDEMKNTRMLGSLLDYDGDGDRAEGIYYEVQGLQEMLYQAIQAYANRISNLPIFYDPATYPYFFIDNNGDGVLTTGENAFENSYKAWTPRLIRATYNFNFTIKDPGIYAHNAKYAIQLLFDSITDLNQVLPEPIDLAKTKREDAGHFSGSAEAYRHWDEDGEVEAACARCHSAYGLPQFLEYGANIGVELSNGFMCSTCHDMADFPQLQPIASVTFPGGKIVSMGGKDVDGKFVADPSNTCLICHQGRESTVSVNAKIGDSEANTINPKLTFSNVHYFAAGASLFGNDVQVAYQFAGKTYVGENATHPLNSCVECHDTHSGVIKLDTCAACHPGNAEPDTIRYGTDNTDWDGDGSAIEPVKDEIATLQAALLDAILAQANANGAPITYGELYPYWVKDLNGNGAQDADEGVRTNAYTSYTPNMLAAAYNYHFLVKEPGNYTHNPMYVIQILIDSIEAVGGDAFRYTRP